MSTRTFPRERRGPSATLGPGLLAAALLLFAAGPLAGCTSSEADGRTPAAPKPLAVVIEAVAAEARALPRALEVTGTLIADAETDVAAETAARVVRVNVERGQVVEAGAVLAELDQQDALNQLAEAEAIEAQTLAKLGLVPGQPFDALETPEVRQARVMLERLELEYQRYERLAKQELVSRSDHDLKRTDYLAQKEQLQREDQRDAPGLSDPAGPAGPGRDGEEDRGRHGHPRAVRGAGRPSGTCTSASTSSGGTKIATLVRVDPLRIELAVPESAVDVGEAGPEGRLHGADLSRPRPSRARSRTSGPPSRPSPAPWWWRRSCRTRAHELQPGLFATARIELPAASPMPFVPASAVRTEAGVSQVFVITSDRAEQRFVQLGREADGQYEIVRGLDVGERVAVRPPDRLADGSAVIEQRRALAMQWLAEVSIKRPVFASVLVLSLVVVGVFSYFNLGVDRFPKVEFPMVSVTTRQTGAAPEDIETEITDQIERAVNTISGIEELRSISTEGVSQVFIQFSLDKNVDVAAQEVRDKVNQILADLPRDIDPPIIDKVDPDAAPILYLSLAAEPADPRDHRVRRQDRAARARVAERRRAGDDRRRPRPGRSTSGSIRPGCAPTTSRSAEVARAVGNQNLQLPGGTVEPGRARADRAHEGPRQRGSRVRRAGRRDAQRHARSSCATSANVEDGTEEVETAANIDGKPGRAAGHPPAVRDQHRRGRRRREGAARRGPDAPAGRLRAPRSSATSPSTSRPSVRHGAGAPGRRRLPGRARGAAVPAQLALDGDRRHRDPGLDRQHVRAHVGDGLHAQHHHPARRSPWPSASSSTTRSSCSRTSTA